MTFLDTAKATFDRVAATNANRHGTAATYHVAGGSDLSRFVYFFEDTDPLDQIDDAGEFNLRSAKIHLSKDATLGVAAPVRADQITVESDKWNIDGIADKRAYWELRMTKVQDVDTTAQRIQMDKR